jgi:hypothetical protein
MMEPWIIEIFQRKLSMSTTERAKQRAKTWQQVQQAGIGCGREKKAQMGMGENPTQPRLALDSRRWDWSAPPVP